MACDQDSSNALGLTHLLPDILSLNEDKLGYLMYTEFITAVIVPNATILLVQADQSTPNTHISWNQAQREWFCSWKHGVANSPPDVPFSPALNDTTDEVKTEPVEIGISDVTVWHTK
ncbi:hypothetical protein K439DRAFT_1615335 [Ramaria rubella]|nr:hypothetical protein K439DRAFT_1615335 [Ramaria rubella]